MLIDTPKRPTSAVLTAKTPNEHQVAVSILLTRLQGMLLSSWIRMGFRTKPSKVIANQSRFQTGLPVLYQRMMMASEKRVSRDPQRIIGAPLWRRMSRRLFSRVSLMSWRLRSGVISLLTVSIKL